MNKPHKHAECIKAWADGAEIEYRSMNYDNWISIKTPTWHDHFEYRIKPQPVIEKKFIFAQHFETKIQTLKPKFGLKVPITLVKLLFRSH